MLKKFCSALLTLPLLCFAQIEKWETSNEEETLFLRRIADFWEEGDDLLVKNQIEEFLETFPESAFSEPLHAALGNLYLKQNNYQEALVCYKKVNEKELKDKLFFNRLECLYQLKEYISLIEACEEKFQAPLENKEEELKTAYYLAIGLYSEGSLANEKSLPLLQRAEPLFENLFTTSYSDEIAIPYAKLLVLLKNYEKASSIYLQLAEKDPVTYEHFLFEAALVQTEYDPELARKTFGSIADMGEEKTHEGAFNWAILSFDLGHFEEILEKQDFILSHMPEGKSASLHLLFGKCYLELNLFEEATSAFETFIAENESKEDLYPALLALLEVSLKSDNLETFISTVSKLKQDYPHDKEVPNVLLIRGQIYKKNGDMAFAKEDFEAIWEGYPQFDRRNLALFEQIDLEFDTTSWETCIFKSKLFLKEFPEDAKAADVWRYLTIATYELSEIDTDQKKELVETLASMLKQKTLFSHEELLDWQFLLAKTSFDLKHYRDSYETLQALLNEEKEFVNRPNALLLLSLCHRDGFNDQTKFIELAEEALAQDADLFDVGALHASLFNAYLERSQENPSLIEKAEEHLFLAFEADAEILDKNLLWLVDTYFSRMEKGENVKENAAKGANLLESYIDQQEIEDPLNKTAQLEKEIFNLAKAYAALHRYSEETALLENLVASQRNWSSFAWSTQREAKFLLGEVYRKEGRDEEALALFNELILTTNNFRTYIHASAALQSAQMRIEQLKKNPLPLDDPEWILVFTLLKNLTIQKTLANEPIHLTAAIEYVNLRSQFEDSPEKKLFLWEKTKRDFESQEDLLSKDYHAAKTKHPDKAKILETYMQWIDAEILLTKAVLQSQENEKQELLNRGRSVLLNLQKTSLDQELSSRAKMRLEKLSATKE